MAYFTDHEIIEMILQNERRSQTAAIEQLYHQNEKKITQLVFSKGVNKEDAKDLFQELIIIFLKKVRSHEFMIHEDARISTYLYKIGMNLATKKAKSNYLRFLRSFKFWENIENTMPDDPDALYQIIEKEDDKRSREIFEMLDYKDQEILKAFVGEKLSMEEVAKKLGYDNAAVVKTRKHRAMKGLRKLIQGTNYKKNEKTRK